jgi:hypothetical protein
VEDQRVAPTHAPPSPTHAFNQLRRHLGRRNGITFDPATGSVAETGTAVCAGPRWSRPLPWPIADDGPVRTWLHHLQRHLEPGRFIGAWLDPRHPLLWVELSLVLHDHDEALRYAAGARQHSVYDLTRDRIVQVPAS